jgi:tRNA-dihydrouridine synthase 1
MRKFVSTSLSGLPSLTQSSFQMFVDAGNKTYRQQNFDLISGEEGDPTTDRPLIVQFCANDPDQLLASAKVVERYCDAIDLNLGCPQDIAKRGWYGSFLQDDWDLIHNLSPSLSCFTPPR